MLFISVLGPVAVRDDGEPVRVPAGKTSELLVRLALEPGVAVRAERLVDDLWADESGTTRPNTLQSKVARLRRALGDPATIVNVDGGYRLAVEPRQVDAFAAVGAAESARRLLDDGQISLAIEECSSALEHFGGDLLAGAGDSSWAVPHRARLDAVHLQLLETWFTARLRTGDAAGVVPDLERSVADHQFQEGLWALLVTALYRAGRQADALAACRRVRDVLREELGLDPGPELQDLERQILAHDDRLAPAAAVALDDRSSAGNLPSLAVALVGRDADTAALVGSVDRNRLVEVIGPGGVGKTALALAAGRIVTMPGGVWLVRLEGTTNMTEVVDATVAALGVTGGEPALVERLRVAPTLLILDNCEHVLADAAVWVERLLDAAPALRVLATSQAALDVAGSAILELEPLDLDDAVTLFVERATAQKQVSATPERDADVRDLCRALDGLPLAIELAAARTRTLPIDEISRRLDDRFVVLNDPTSRRPERRRALRATIAWSYDLLFPDDQRGLWALATFAGGASLAGAEVVLGALGVPPVATIDIIGRLAARSLVIAEASRTGPRYRLLDSIRAFALDALAESGMAGTARSAHARWYADAAAESTEGVRGARQGEHLAFVRDERANIDTALAWTVHHDPALALAIATRFGWAWVVLGDSRGAERILAALAADGGHAPGRERAVALLLAGWIEASTGDLEHARRHVLEADALAIEAGDAELQARAAYHLAYVVSHHGDFRDALALTDRSRELYADLDRPWDLVANGLFATRAAISAADEGRAVRSAEDVHALLAVVEDPWLHVRFEAMSGELARLQHRFVDAIDHLARAVETSHRLGFRQTEAYQVASLGRAQSQAGDAEAGAATLARSVEKAEAIGDVRMAALARVHLGRVLRTLGRTDDARRVLEQSTAWHRRAGGGEQALLGECLLAALDLSDGVGGAGPRLEAVVAAARDRGDAAVEVFGLDALARAAAESGDVATAATLLERADGRMVSASHFVSERDRVDAVSAHRAMR